MNILQYLFFALILSISMNVSTMQDALLPGKELRTNTTMKKREVSKIWKSIAEKHDFELFFRWGTNLFIVN